MKEARDATRWLMVRLVRFINSHDLHDLHDLNHVLISAEVHCVSTQPEP